MFQSYTLDGGQVNANNYSLHQFKAFLYCPLNMLFFGFDLSQILGVRLEHRSITCTATRPEHKCVLERVHCINLHGWR